MSADPAGRMVEGAGPRLWMVEGQAAGPPLLLLHGVSRSWRDFVPLLPILSARWQVFGIDLRGHGRSQRARDGYVVTNYVDDIVAVVEREFAEPAALIGHSLGALTAAAVAARLGDKVRGVILEDPPSPAFLNDIDATMYRVLFTAMHRLASSGRPIPDIARELSELRIPVEGGARTVRMGELRDAASLRFHASCLLDVDPDVYLPILERRWVEGYDPSTWSKIAAPTLLFRSDVDQGGMLPRDDAEAMVGAMKDGTWIDFQGVGHQIHWQAPETMGRMCCAFLESLR